MRRYLVLAILSLIAALLGQRNVNAQQVSEGERLAMYSKPSVVRIIDGVSGVFYFQPPTFSSAKVYPVSYVALGSGLFINPNGYIATNAHVVNITQQGEDKAKELLFGQYVSMLAHDYNQDPRTYTRETISSIAQYSSLRDIKFYHHVLTPDGSPFPFEIKAYGAPTGQGKDVAIIKIEIKNAPILRLGDSDKVQLQDHVTVIGYPGAADTFNTGILDAKSALEASITDGKLSARKRASSGAPILQVSAPATHGNSGGPVLTDHDEVIGLLTFGGDRVNGQEVSGFAFVVPSSTVMEFVKQAGAANEPGLVDQLYRDGLDLYWQGYYSKAISKFEEVKRLFPQHSEIDHLIRESQLAISEGKDRSGIPAWLIVGAVAVVLLILFLVVVALILFLIMRSRRKRRSLTAQPEPAATGNRSPLQSPGGVPQHEAAIATAMPHAPSAVGNEKSVMPRQPIAMSPDKAMTMDLSAAMLAMDGGMDTAPIKFGSIKWVSGPLAGQQFEIGPEGSYIGRDGALSQIVLPDPRISKQHLWIGPRDGRVAIVDNGSRNGTFRNEPHSQRVTEAFLIPGDTVILGEADIARFEYVS